MQSSSSRSTRSRSRARRTGRFARLAILDALGDPIWRRNLPSYSETIPYGGQPTRLAPVIHGSVPVKTVTDRAPQTGGSSVPRIERSKRQGCPTVAHTPIGWAREIRVGSRIGSTGALDLEHSSGATSRAL